MKKLIALLALLSTVASAQTNSTWLLQGQKLKPLPSIGTVYLDTQRLGIGTNAPGTKVDIQDLTPLVDPSVSIATGNGATGLLVTAGTTSAIRTDSTSNTGLASIQIYQQGVGDGIKIQKTNVAGKHILFVNSEGNELGLSVPPTGLTDHNLILPADDGDVDDCLKTDGAGNLSWLTCTAGGVVPPSEGGTGVANNDASTLTWSGANAVTFTTTAPTSVTLPTSGTLYGTDSVVSPADGGTGVSNNTLATLTRVGNHALTLTTSGTTDVTLPTTGTLATLSGTELLTGKTLASPTVTSQLLLQNLAGDQPTLKFSEDPDNGTNVVITRAPATLGADWTWTLPSDDGDADEFLQTNGTGFSTWEPIDASTDISTGQLPLARGGTNRSMTADAGAIAYSDSDSMEFTAAGTTGQYLKSNGTGTPTWSAVDLASSSVTGVLSLANGGTNGTDAAVNGGIVWSNATGYKISTPAGTTSDWVLSGGAGSPTMASTTTTAKIFDVTTDSTPVTITGDDTQTANIFTVEADGGADSITVNGDDDVTGANVVIKGTATDDEAAAGYVGEIVAASRDFGSLLTLSTNVTANVTDTPGSSITLGAGDWDMSGAICYDSAGGASISNLDYGVSVDTAELPPTSAIAVSVANEIRFTDGQTTAVWTAARTKCFTIPAYRVSLAASDVFYLVARAVFTVADVHVWGSFQARRVR